jgi:magnesium-transporting ATPase (P-type)
MIPPNEYAEWSAKYKEAQALIDGREAACAQLSEMIEKDLILMGATAIEDKLQVGVPECIDTLARSGIKIWVLTVLY